MRLRTLGNLARKKRNFQRILEYKSHQKFDQVLELAGEAKKPSEEELKSACRPKMNCWNCMGNHSIRDCPEPRNYNEIQKNRNEFTSRAPQKVGRYHVENGDQKYGRFVPGQISRELKRALGIGDNQLPHHIYRYSESETMTARQKIIGIAP